MYDQSDGPWADRAARRCATWQPSRDFRERVRGKGIRSMSLKINIRETADATILDISGRVSLGDALGDLRDPVREALGGDQQTLLLKLAEVRFIDSSGVGQLLGGYS